MKVNLNIETKSDLFRICFTLLLILPLGLLCACSTKQPTRSQAISSNQTNKESLSGDNILNFPTSLESQEQFTGVLKPIWNTSDLIEVEGHKDQIIGIYPLSLSPGLERSCVSLSRTGEVLVWDLNGKTKAYQLVNLHTEIRAASFNFARNELAMATKHGIVVFSVNLGRIIAQLSDFKTRVRALTQFNNSSDILIAAADSHIYCWHVRRKSRMLGLQNPLDRYVWHSAPINALAIHPSDGVFFSADWSGELLAWQPYDADAFEGQFEESIFGARIGGGQAVRVEGQHQQAAAAGVEKLMVSPDGKWLFAIGGAGNLVIWKIRGFERTVDVPLHKGLVYGAAFSPNAQLFATAARDDQFKVWQFNSAPNLIKEESFLTLKKELTLKSIISLTFLDNDTVLGGTKDGRIYKISINS